MANIRSLSVDLTQITTNSVDDRQKPMPHRGGQRRPSVDRSLKIRWNACGHVWMSRNPSLRRTARHAKKLAETNAYYFCTGVLKLGHKSAVSPCDDDAAR